MKNKTSRRKFIVSAAMAATAAYTPAALLAAERSNELPAEDQKGLVFLFQGDSITDGNRGRNQDPNHIMGHGYAFSIASRIGADFASAGYTFYNRGISGNRVPDLQARWQQDIIDLKPDVLSILIGINDTAAVVENNPKAQTAAGFEAGYRQLLTDAKTANPAIIFVLALPFVYPVGKRKENWQQWKEETLLRSAVVRKLAKEFNAVLVDYPAVFDRAVSKAAIDYWIWDGIHPTVPAHELMAREWIQELGSRLSFLKKYKYTTKAV